MKPENEFERRVRESGDFERRVRESEAALIQHIPPGKRPFVETWWYYLLVTMWGWLQFLWAALDWRAGEPFRKDRLVGMTIVAVFLPLWVWLRAKGERQRQALREQQSAAKAP